MFRNLLGKLMGDPNQKEIERLGPLVERINALEAEFQRKTDAELRAQTDVFRACLQRGEALDDILPEAFALVREAAKRTVGMRHFDVQLIGGIVLHQGKIAEMKTGEGKTLVATLPIYLNALTGKGVHLVTVNDYLARRDAVWMGPIYHRLGLSVGLLQGSNKSFLFEPGYTKAEFDHLRPASRRDAYAADITYGTNHEFGFDYLRDNLAYSLDEQVQRPLSYAIVDEVDNVFIDEARTPLIISGPSEDSDEDYRLFARIAPKLKEGVDYELEEKTHTVFLTEAGLARVEEEAGIDNIYDPVNQRYVHYMEQALKAQVLFREGRDYIIQRDQVVLVDEFTGRLMPDRRLSDGLHQALEAKHSLKIRPRMVTQATITIQNYFRMYPKLAGMTGTAASEAEEFHKIYNLEVVVIPTHKPVIRIDAPDVVYRTRQAKLQAIVAEIESAHKRGQPVLVGTTSVEKSEELSRLLQARGIEHVVLNAKEHAREALIIARAGEPGRVTVATNMAGRGVDIKLGGELTDETIQQAQRVLMQRGIDPFQATPEQFDSAVAEVDPDYALRREKVLDAGGLYVLGTERHEARRIDNQLRGRAGRQGEPGLSRFYLSLEDDLMRRFGGDNIANLMSRFGVEDDIPIEHNLVSRSIESAQARVEGYNFDIRKHLLEYDDVLNKQRELIYAQRQRILTKDNLWSDFWDMVDTEAEERIAAVRADAGRLPELVGFYDAVMPLQYAPVQEQKVSGGKKHGGKGSATKVVAESMRYPYRLSPVRSIFLPFSLSFVAGQLAELPADERAEAVRHWTARALEQYHEYIFEKGIEQTFAEGEAGYEAGWESQVEQLEQRIQIYLDMLEERGRPFQPRDMLDQVARGLPIRLSVSGADLNQMDIEDVRAIIEDALRRAYHLSVCDGLIRRALALLPARLGIAGVRLAEIEQEVLVEFLQRAQFAAYDDQSADGLDSMRENVERGAASILSMKLPELPTKVLPLARVELSELAKLLGAVVETQYQQWAEKVSDEIEAHAAGIAGDDDPVAVGQWLLDTLAFVEPNTFQIMDWRIPPAFIVLAVVDGWALDEVTEAFRAHLRAGAAERQAVWGEAEMARFGHLLLKELAPSSLDALARFWGGRILGGLDMPVEALPAEWADVFSRVVTLHDWREGQFGVWPMFDALVEKVAESLEDRLLPQQGDLDEPLMADVERYLQAAGHFNDPDAEGAFLARRLEELGKSDSEQLAAQVGEGLLNPLRSERVADLPSELREHLLSLLESRGRFRDERRLQDFLIHQSLADLGEERAAQVCRHLAAQRLDEERTRTIEELEYSLRSDVMEALRETGHLINPQAEEGILHRPLDELPAEEQRKIQVALGADIWPEGVRAGDLDAPARETLWRAALGTPLLMDISRLHAFSLSDIAGVPADLKAGLRAYLAAKMRGMMADTPGSTLPAGLREVVQEVLETNGYFADAEKRRALESQTLSSLDGKVITAVERAIGRQVLEPVRHQKVMNLEQELRESIFRYLDQENIYRKSAKRRAFMQKPLADVDTSLFDGIAGYVGRQKLTELRARPISALPEDVAALVWEQAQAAGLLRDGERVRAFREQGLALLPADQRSALLRALDARLEAFLASPEAGSVPYEGIVEDIREYLSEQGYFQRENAEALFVDLRPERLDPGLREALYGALGAQEWKECAHMAPAEMPAEIRQRVLQALRRTDVVVDKGKEQALLHTRVLDLSSEERRDVVAYLAQALQKELAPQRVASLPEEQRKAIRAYLDDVGFFVDDHLREEVLSQTLGGLRAEDWRALALSWGQRALAPWMKRPVREMPTDLQRLVLDHLRRQAAFLDEERRRAFRERGLDALTPAQREEALTYARQVDRERLSTATLERLSPPFRWEVEGAAVEVVPPAEYRRMREFEGRKIGDVESDLLNIFLRYAGYPHVKPLRDRRIADLAGDEDIGTLLRDFLGDRVALEILRRVMLAYVSRLWIDYLTDIEDLRQGIGLEAFGQRDPLVEYKRRAFQMFQELVVEIRRGVVSRVFALPPFPLQIERRAA